MTQSRREFLSRMSSGAAMAASAGLQAAQSKPNLLVILADDLGYSDIAPFGGEIATPNLARLAKEGVRFTQFYNCARCCPTRASLLTGVYNHQAGVGHMIQDYGVPSYQGYLNGECTTIAEALKPAGYRTLMSGKWHVGESRPHWPLDRGFDRYFGLISGASSYFELSKGRKMALDNEPWQPEGPFYMTDAIADHAVRMVREESARPQPLLLYLAFTAPHWPLHAPPEDVERYRGKYLKGWDVLRNERHERQRAAGLAGKNWKMSPRDAGVPAWSDVPQKDRDEWDLRMAVYAAQVDRLDRGIGRVLDSLRQSGRLDNTLVLFVSDNGGCAEENIGGEKAAANPVPGGPDSFTSYRKPWANASNTPFRYWKQMTHEGGISTPAIAWWPQGLQKPGRFDTSPGHVIDILPTLLDAAGAASPAGRLKPEGRSLLPALRGGRVSARPITGWEHQGHRAIRMDQYKLVSSWRQPWELYDLSADRTELNDLAAKDPRRVSAMEAEWKSWAARCGVRDWATVRRTRP